MYISKNQLVNRIRRAAKKYKNCLIGKTFLFIYENGYIEVLENGLRTSEIFFDSEHPFDFANLKTQCLKDLYKITVQDVLIADGFLIHLE